MCLRLFSLSWLCSTSLISFLLFSCYLHGDKFCTSYRITPLLSCHKHNFFNILNPVLETVSIFELYVLYVMLHLYKNIFWFQQEWIFGRTHRKFNNKLWLDVRVNQLLYCVLSLFKFNQTFKAQCGQPWKIILYKHEIFFKITTALFYWY